MLSSKYLRLFLAGVRFVGSWSPLLAGRAMDFGSGVPAWMPSLPKLDLNMQGLPGLGGSGNGNGQPFGQDVLPILNEGVLPILKGAGVKGAPVDGMPSQIGSPQGDPLQVSPRTKRDEALPMPVEQDEAFVM